MPLRGSSQVIEAHHAQARLSGEVSPSAMKPLNRSPSRYPDSPDSPRCWGCRGVTRPTENSVVPQGHEGTPLSSWHSLLCHTPVTLHFSSRISCYPSLLRGILEPLDDSFHPPLSSVGLGHVRLGVHTAPAQDWGVGVQSETHTGMELGGKAVQGAVSPLPAKPSVKYAGTIFKRKGRWKPVMCDAQWEIKATAAGGVGPLAACSMPCLSNNRRTPVPAHHPRNPVLALHSPPHFCQLASLPCWLAPALPSLSPSWLVTNGITWPLPAQSSLDSLSSGSPLR